MSVIRDADPPCLVAYVRGATVLALLLAFLCAGCASARSPLITRIEWASPPSWWQPEPRLRACWPAGEIVTLDDGRVAVILICPGDRVVAADARTGQRIQ